MYERFDWPDYQQFMEEIWFEEEAVYSATKDCYFIPVELAADFEERNYKGLTK